MIRRYTGTSINHYLKHHKNLIKPAPQGRTSSAREFNAAAAMVDKAYDLYKACHTEEAMAMAQNAISQINALSDGGSSQNFAAAGCEVATSAVCCEV